MREPPREAHWGEESRSRAWIAVAYRPVWSGMDPERDDVPLHIVSDTLTVPEVQPLAAKAGREMDRNVVTAVSTEAEWRSQRKRTTSLATKIACSPHGMIVGTDVDGT